MSGKVVLCIEGGGTTRGQQAPLREGFHRFLERAGVDMRRVKIQLLGAGTDTVKSFESERRQEPQQRFLLLIDSDAPLSIGGEPDADRHWMVQIMEAWFLADVEALERFYKKEFKASALPRNPQVERVPKAEVERALHEATKKTQKGSYQENKRLHAAALLKEIDPVLVQRCAPYCKRLIEALPKV